jgi:outer membrane receptor protein involved in Fe transport
MNDTGKKEMIKRSCETFKVGALASALLATTAVTPVTAQSASEAQDSAVKGPVFMEEVIVTSRRRDESLTDVPIAINAYNNQLIEQRGISNVSSVADLTPGLEFDTGASPADVRPSLRGISLIEGRSNVAIIIDGIDVTGVSLNTIIGGGGSQTAAALMDLERIEVVKGPQSVYFGRSAFAGAIQFISKDPEFETGAKVTAALGDHGRRELTAHVTGPVVDDVLAAKLSATYNDFDGFYKNPGNGRDLGGSETLGFAGSLLYDKDALRAKAQFQYIDEDVDPGAGFLWVRPDISQFGVNIIGEDQLDESQVGISSNIPYAGNQSETWRGILDLSYDVNESVTVSSLTGFNKVSSWIQFDFDRKQDNVASGPMLGDFEFCLPDTCVGIFDFDTELQQISQELRVSYESEDVRGLIGGYFFDENYEELDYTRFVGAQEWVGDLRTGIPARPSRLSTNTYSVFGSIDADVTDALTLTGELRFNHEVIRAEAATAYNILFQTGSTDITFAGRDTFNSWLPRFNARYALSDEANVYASVAKGTKPGGFNVGQVRDDLRPFGQESIWTYEVGAKASLLDRKVNVEASLYYSEWNDVQVTTICYGINSPFGPEAACPTATAVSLNYIINADKAEVKGAEFGLQALLTDEVTFGMRYAYTDSKFKDFLARDVFPAPASPDDRQFGGNRMPLVAKHALSADIRYETPVSSEASIFTELSGRYRSSRFARFDNRVKLSDKAVFDARIGMEGDSWTALVFVNNVFNDKTPDFSRYYGNFNPSNPNGEYIVAPAKRSFGMRVSSEF